MLKKTGQFLEKWGYYGLAVLCAAVILLSTLWTRRQQAWETPGAQALSDQSQRLAEGTPTPESAPLVRPVSGEVLRGYSESPVYQPRYRLWQVHPALDFAAEDGEAILAVAAGVVTACQDEVRIDHGDGLESVYRGARQIVVQLGQRLRAGDRIALAGGEVALEAAEAHICVSLLKDGQPYDYYQDLVDKTGK